MCTSRFSYLGLLVLAASFLSLLIGYAKGQEVALTPIETTEVARGYRAEALKLRPLVNEKGETLGRINDFIFGKDGNIYVIILVGEFTVNHPIAIPFRSLKLDDPSGSILLPGVTRSMLDKLPVYIRR